MYVGVRRVPVVCTAVYTHTQAESFCPSVHCSLSACLHSLECCLFVLTRQRTLDSVGNYIWIHCAYHHNDNSDLSTLTSGPIDPDGGVGGTNVKHQRIGPHFKLSIFSTLSFQTMDGPIECPHLNVDTCTQ